MIAYVVVEGRDGGDRLREALDPNLLDEVWIEGSPSRNDATSIVRTLVVTRGKPVAIVVNAWADVPVIIRERREEVTEVIAAVAHPDWFRVIVAAPTLEAVLDGTGDEGAARRAALLGEVARFLDEAREKAAPPVGASR